MTLHDFLLAQLDAAANGKGRAVHDYELRVESLSHGLIALRVTPRGFDSEEMIFGIEGNTLLDRDALTAKMLEVGVRNIAAEAAVVDAFHAAEEARLAAEKEEHDARVAASQARTGDHA